MQHKKSVVVASLLSSLLLVSAQEVTQTSAQQGDVDPNGSSTCVTIDTNLRYKMRDTSSDGDISNLQDFLIANRYMQGTPTGYFGLGTFNAVKQFQKRSGLSPTGYVGALTRAKIKDTSCNQTADTGSQSQSGDRGEDHASQKQGMMNDTAKQMMEKLGQGMDKMKSLMASSTGLMSKVNSLMSEEDKTLLKQKEDDLKVKRDAFKSALDSFGGSTKNLTEEQKTTLKSKMDEVTTAEKSLNETRKSVMDKVSSSLSEGDKALLEKMKPSNEKREGTKSSEERKGEEGDRRPMMQRMEQNSSSLPAREGGVMR